MLEISKTDQNTPTVCFSEEGDAFGAKLSQVNSRRCKAVVSLRAATCVDCHMIKLEDMEDVLSPYESTYAHVQRLMERSNQVITCSSLQTTV